MFLLTQQPSTGEHIPSIKEISGGSQMESRAQDIIKEIKQIKEESKFTYLDLMEMMQELDEKSIVSLSTIRRIFRDGSETRASSFNFEEVLLPVYNAVKALDKKPKDDSPFAKELNGYKAVIRVQNEELDRLLELKEHLDERVDFLVEQINKKDMMIQDLMQKQSEKDELIKRLMDKCL